MQRHRAMKTNLTTKQFMLATFFVSLTRPEKTQACTLVWLCCSSINIRQDRLIDLNGLRLDSMINFGGFVKHWSGFQVFQWSLLPSDHYHGVLTG